MTAGLLSVSKGGIHLAKKTKKAAPQSRETAGIKSFLDMIAPSVVKFEPDHFISATPFAACGRCGSIPRRPMSRLFSDIWGKGWDHAAHLRPPGNTCRGKAHHPECRKQKPHEQLQHQRPAADDHGGKQSTGCGIAGGFHAPQPRAAAPLRRLYRADRFGL